MRNPGQAAAGAVAYAEPMKPGTRSFYADVVQAAIAHIAADLEVAVDLTALARNACLSPFHFHRIFRGMVGETPLELRRRLCLERAAWRLAREDTGVTAIALDAGYDTHEAFTRAFRVRFGTSPSGFRQRTYRRFELATPCGVHYIPTGGVVAFTPRNSGGEHMTVEIEEMPALRVAAVRHIGPYNHIGQAFERLGAILGGAGLLKGPPPMMLAIYYDDPESTPVEDLRADAGIVVPAGLALPPGLSEVQVAAGRYARTRHTGPYEQLGDVWARFMGEWLPASGHRVASRPSFEVYRNTPMDTPKDQLVTDIYVPVE